MRKISLVFIAFAILALNIIPLISADPNDNFGCGMMYGAFGNYGYSMIVLSWITYIAVIILAIAGIYWLIKNANKKK